MLVEKGRQIMHRVHVDPEMLPCILITRLLTEKLKNDPTNFIQNSKLDLNEENIIVKYIVSEEWQYVIIKITNPNKNKVINRYY